MCKERATAPPRVLRGLHPNGGILLVATVWISAGIFGQYILAFYAAALLGGDLGNWIVYLVYLCLNVDLIHACGSLFLAASTSGLPFELSFFQ